LADVTLGLNTVSILQLAWRKIYLYTNTLRTRSSNQFQTLAQGLQAAASTINSVNLLKLKSRKTMHAVRLKRR